MKSIFYLSSKKKKRNEKKVWKCFEIPVICLYWTVINCAFLVIFMLQVNDKNYYCDILFKFQWYVTISLT